MVMVRPQLSSLDNVLIENQVPPGGRRLILNPLMAHRNKSFQSLMYLAVFIPVVRI
jgi:hypothetical protein